MKTKPKNIVGARVRKARAKCRPPLTQQELSDRVVRLGARIDRAGIAKVEVGLRRVYDHELTLLAKATGVSVTWLLTGRRS